SFKSSCEGDSVRSHLKLFLYQSIVAGVTFARYCRSRMNCSKLGSMFPHPGTQIWRETALTVDSKGEWLSLVEHLVRDQGVGGSNPLSPTNKINNLCNICIRQTPLCVAVCVITR